MGNRLLEIVYNNKRTPSILPLSYPGLQLKNYSIMETVIDAKKQYYVLKALVEEFDLDVIFNFLELSVEPEVLGAKVRYQENIQPSVVECPVKTIEDIENLRIPDPNKDERMSTFIECMKLMNKGINIPKLAATNGPFTIASQLMGLEESLRATIKNKNYLKRLLEITAETLNKYIQSLINAGAEIIAICEPVTSMLSSSQFDEFSGQYIYDIFSSNPKGISILHICGNTRHIILEMVKTGAEGISLDTQVDMLEAAQIVPKSTAIIGNIDPVRIMHQCDSYTVKEKVIELKQKMTSYNNYIASTGCDLPHTTPLGNIHAFLEALNY